MKVIGWLILCILITLSAIMALADRRSILVARNNAGGAAFSPSDVEGLQFWFKGDTLAGAEGGTVSNWVNSASQSGWYVTNATSGQWPQLTNNFNGTGKKALRFDGVDDILWVSNSAALNVTRNTNDCVIVAVVRINHSESFGGPFSITTPGSFPREHVYLSDADAPGVSRRNMDSDVSTGLENGPISTNQSICIYVDFVHTNKIDVTGSSLSVFTNNVLAGASTAGTHTNTSDTASAYISVSTPNFFTGEIAEVLVYVPKPSAANRTNIYNYLKAKYSLSP